MAADDEPRSAAAQREEHLRRKPPGSDSAATTLTIGGPASDAADLLLDGITMALQEFDTETLLAIADYRESIHKDGWMQTLIREYVEVWR